MSEISKNECVTHSLESLATTVYNRIKSMDISQKLQEFGWHLTEGGLKKILTLISNDRNVRKVIDVALDMDLREIGGGALPIGKREDRIKGNIVLQVLKVRNIAAPKVNEASKVAPRMLLLELTDGQTTIPAVEMHNIPMLSLALPPGRKIYLKGEYLKCVAGYLMLHSIDMTILGGRVENLEEKWEIARTISEFTRSGLRTCGDTGPPSWVPFGKKLQANKLQDAKNFKSLQANASNNNQKKGDNESFNNFRSEAIAEASKKGSKKVFSGGGQQIVDYNIKKIIDKGYSEDDAKRALTQSNNNLERAFNYLKRATISSSLTTTTTPSASVSNPFSSNRYNNRNNNNEDSSTKVEISKPTGNVTLSEFLADKLPTRKLVENFEKLDIKETAKERIPNPFRSNAIVDKNQNNSNSNNNTHDNRQQKPTQMNISEQKPSISSNNTNRVQQKNQSDSKTKFENNMSSSFAANQRGSSSNGTGSYQNRHRSEYNATQNNNSNTNNNREHSMNKEHNSRIEQQSHINGRGNGDKTLRTKFGTNNNNNNSSSTRGRTDNSSRNPVVDNSYEKMNSVDLAENNPYHNRREREREGNHVNSTNTNRQQQKTFNKGNQEKQHMDSNNKNIKQSVIANNNQNRRNEPRRIQNNNHENTNSKNLVGMVFNSKSANLSAKSGISQQQRLTADQNKSQNSKISKTKHVESEQQPQQQVPYDASKIIGFQSKETNERAMNLLKSQGVNIKCLSAKETQKQHQQQQPSPPLHQQQQMTKSINKSQKNNPLEQNNLKNELQLHLSDGFKNNIPQMNYHHNKTTIPTAATVFSPPNVTDNYGMVVNEPWTWKIGDICLAKYWDDGCFYEAEITAISERTCVVYFLGYGNHEEVLKTDCLPITDGNHKAINFNKNMEYSSKHENQFPGYDNRSGGGIYEGHQRHRSERQVYVPPPKRSEI